SLLTADSRWLAIPGARGLQTRVRGQPGTPGPPEHRAAPRAPPAVPLPRLSWFPRAGVEDLRSTLDLRSAGVLPKCSHAQVALAESGPPDGTGAPGKRADGCGVVLGRADRRRPPDARQSSSRGTRGCPGRELRRGDGAIQARWHREGRGRAGPAHGPDRDHSGEDRGECDGAVGGRTPPHG